MKNLFLLFIPLSIIACSGNEETSEDETTKTTTTPTDSVAIAPAFTDFKHYINSLDKDLENLDSAFAKYEASKINFTQDQKDSSLFLIKDFMHSLEVTEEEQEVYWQEEESRKRIEKKYSAVGLEIWSEEGYLFPMPDIKYLEKKFKKDISVELDDYLDVLKVTFRQTSNDAGLSVEWSELADMVIVCEDYLVENPESKYCAEVLDNYTARMNFLLWGLDNTPIIDYWTDETQKQLNADVSTVYQKLIKDNKHKTGKIIQDHVEFLESKNFEYTYDEVQYLTADETKMYLGLE